VREHKRAGSLDVRSSGDRHPRHVLVR
jgi:hypothetical protein